ncbi:hypothetical protein [Streptomyces chartreusis]|uniref:hypothetical protein n=1 Tax=Streptomyces chartreusis TaxID=1969 RepID=UPI000B86271D
MEDRDDDVVPFAALLGGYWLEPAFDDQCDAVGCEHVTDLLPSRSGRATIVVFAAVTVVAVVVAVMM